MFKRYGILIYLPTSIYPDDPKDHNKVVTHCLEMSDDNPIGGIQHPVNKMSDANNADSNKNIKKVIVKSNKKEEVIVPTSIPQKRKLDVDTQSNNNIYEPDIESFVSNCIPGVCFTSTNNQRRNTKIRKRSLPSLQYLATVELDLAISAKAKLEKKEQDAKAKEEARRILNQNEQSAILESDGDAKVPQMESAATINKANEEEEEAIPTTVTTTTIERKSNILNPPILQDFLEKVKKGF